jgi:hypothetical protein
VPVNQEYLKEFIALNKNKKIKLIFKSLRETVIYLPLLIYLEFIIKVKHSKFYKLLESKNYLLF